MTTDSTLPEIKTLDAWQAVALWLKGKNEWNKWVEENPHYNVNFSGVDFQFYRSDSTGPISFAGFKFPIGDVSFSDANFGDGNVDFTNAKFGDGYVNFSDAKFGYGDVLFIGAKFGGGKVGFFGAKFGDGNMDFTNAKFGDADVSFSGAKFGVGNVDFSQAEFGDGNVNFWSVEFGDGSVYFIDTKFGYGNVDFSGSKFGDGNVEFWGCEFGNINADFHNLQCKARFAIFGAQGALYALSFRGATFSNTVSLSGLKVNSMIDLVNTKLTNQLSLHGLECQLKRTRNRFGLKKADPADAERANRAKELAEANKHHALALRFHADEMRAKRWQSGTGVLSSILDLVFDLLCNYGQSVFRPAMLWVFSIFAFGLPYAALAKECLTSVSQAFKLLIFSLSNSLPFLTSAGAARTDGLKLFDENITYSAVLPVMMAQGVVTVILMFLIGLGLRNRFRL